MRYCGASCDGFNTKHQINKQEITANYKMQSEFQLILFRKTRKIKFDSNIILHTCTFNTTLHVTFKKQ